VTGISNFQFPISNWLKVRAWKFARGLAAVCFGLLPAQASHAQLAGKGVAARAAAPVERVDAACQKAVQFIISNQDATGAISDPDKRQAYSNPMTALSLMALAAIGNLPTDATREGDAMRRAIQFLVRPSGAGDPQWRGYLGGDDASRMYGHGIATLALTEMLGMGVDKNQDRLIREKCQRAIDLTLRSQRVRKYDARFIGGWRYTPDSPDADLSVSVWHLMALRSAKNAGLLVPKESIDLAVVYLRRSYESPRDASGRATDLKSGFAYTPGHGPTFAMVAAGLLAMQVCGQYELPEVAGSANWLRDYRLTYGDRWFFYGIYYYAQAMHKRGGEFADLARRTTEGILLPKQAADGSWLADDGQERGCGRVYSSALAVLSLSVKFHFLPIYQD
jgi:hypothetical protein